jgi:hypothetical protein
MSIDMLESELADPVLAYLARHRYATYVEVPWILNGTEYVVDIVGVKQARDWHAEGRVERTHIMAVELKDRISPELIIQVRRLQGFATFITAAVCEPRRRSKVHEARRADLDRMGCGLLYVNDADVVTAQLEPVQDHGADIRTIRAAICEAQQGRAGVPSPQRVRPDRWDHVREQLRERGPLIGKEIDFRSPSEKREFFRIAPRGEVRGVACDEQAVPYRYSVEA